MSHIVIHRIEDIAKRRMSRAIQIDALAPYAQRVSGSLWQPYSPTYLHRTPTHIQRAGRIELGEEPIPAVDLRSPGAAGDAGGSFGTAAPPRIAMLISARDDVTNLDPGTMQAASSQPLPWDARIVSLVTDTEMPAAGAALGFAADQQEHDYTAKWSAAPGRPLLQMSHYRYPGSALYGAPGAATYAPIGVRLLAGVQHVDLLDGVGYGAVLYAGERLVVIIQHVQGAALASGRGVIVHATFERADVTSVRATRPAPAPAPAPTAPAPAPTTAPTPAPSGLTYETETVTLPAITP